MSRAGRLALVLCVLGAVGFSIGLSTTQPATSTAAQAVASAPAEPVQAPAAEGSPDPFFGQGDFTATPGNEACTLCLSQNCTQTGAPCGWSGCLGTCKVCNGQFNCWKSRQIE